MKTERKISPYQMIVNLSIVKGIDAALEEAQDQKTYCTKNLKIMRTISKAICIGLISTLFSLNVNAQIRETVAVLNIDSRGVIQNPESMGYLVRLELEKTGVYNVMDKYDVADIVEKNNLEISGCYGKSCLIEVGKSLGVRKMVTGSAERFGEKIVITLRLINVESGEISNSDATEYLNLPVEIQKMVEISVKNLLGIDNDPTKVNLLVAYDLPINSPMTTLKLNGPRMGIAYISDKAGERLQAPKTDGGYDMYPITTQFGYQWETQYLSAGDFQALVECIALVGGLESGQFVPSVALMNGFRDNQTGLEFAFGPVFKIVRTSNGYYENTLLNGNPGDGKWHQNKEWGQDKSHWIDGDANHLVGNPNTIYTLPDSRGSTNLTANLVLAFGRTFKSGYLNVPVNFYVIPKKNATVYGMSVGFNIGQRRRAQ